MTEEEQFHAAIMACLPGSLTHIATCTGVGGQPLWDAIHILRREGKIVRSGKRGSRMYSLALELKQAQRAQGGAAHSDELDELAAEARRKREKRAKRKRPVLLAWIDGWPVQDPGRRMVWRVVYEGRAVAAQELRYLEANLGHEASFEVAMLTAAEWRAIRLRGYSLREVKEREAQLRAQVS